MRAISLWWARSVERLSEIAGSSSFAYSAWHMSLLLAAWGIWLMIPNGTFDAGPVYATMDSMASSFTWGLVAFLVGGSKMHLVLAKKPISLAILCLVSGYIWVVTGLAFLTAAPSNTGWVVYSMLGFYEFWLYKRLSSRHNDDR